MPDFQYKALDRNGGLQTGELKAADRNDMFRQLERKGWKPVRVTELNREKTDDKSRPQGVKNRRQASSNDEEYRSGDPIKLKRAEVILFTEELSDMLSAGLQLEPALHVLENRSDKGNIKIVSSELRSMVRDGMGFNVALRKVSPSFGQLYCSIASAGEASGSLDRLLKRQAEHMVAISNIRSQVTGALAYPAFVLAMAIGVCFFVLFYLLPQLVDLMNSMAGANVPPLATFLMGFTGFLTKTWYWFVGGLGALALLFKIWKDNPVNKPVWDEFKLKMPFVGGLLSANFYVMFMETLANLISNGLPLVRALELTRNATDNLYARNKLDTVIAQVGDGRALSQALYRTELFPPVIVDMVVVGEQTGKLDDALSNAAKRSDKALKQTINALMALLMPVILILLAIVIGMVLYLIFSLIGETISNIRR